MANEEQVARLRQSVAQWNEWRRLHLHVRPDLRSADLNNADLRRANLRFADLKQANLSQADLSRADLRSAELHDADLSFAEVREARLRQAVLSGANLSGARLVGADLGCATLRSARLVGAHLSTADLSAADLSGTDLFGARLWGTIFAHNDLCTAKGLASLIHTGPSRIELQTVKLPQDGSAVHFLRGAGVADAWIDIYRSTMMHPIEYASCFLSYCSIDELLARRFHADLQDQGVRCWFAPHDLRPGELLRKGIDEAIHMQDKLLLILSKHSVESGWVGYEVETALNREIRELREILFPIRIDDAVFQTTAHWAVSLRDQRYIGDFTQWAEPSHYQQMFERLLRDLKANDATPRTPQ